MHVLYSVMDPPLDSGINALICLGPRLCIEGFAQSECNGVRESQVAGGAQADLLSRWSKIPRRSRVNLPSLLLDSVL